MDRRTPIVVVVWVLVLADAVRQGFMLPALRHTSAWRFDAFGIFAVIMPLGLFTVVAFGVRGYPFDVPPLRAWINRKFGDGSYEGFCAKLRLTLLFSIGGLVIGIIGLVRAIELGAAEGAFASASFFISGGIGFFVLRTVLAKRGLSFE